MVLTDQLIPYVCQEAPLFCFVPVIPEGGVEKYQIGSETASISAHMTNKALNLLGEGIRLE